MIKRSSRSFPARRVVGLGLLAAVAAVALGTLPAANGATSEAAANGAPLVVGIVGAPWPSLGPPPATESAAFVVNEMDAIYGQLFSRAPSGAIVPDLAQSYAYSKSGTTLTIHLRSGVKFSDGTAFNAAAVAAHLQSTLDPTNACQCLGDFSNVTSVTTSGSLNVVMHLKQPDYSLPQKFVGQAPNWVPSPTALSKMGAAAFGQAPVGAGPYTVVSNVASSKLVLAANKGYWQKSLPHIQSLTFEDIPDDQTEYADLQAGSIQLALGMTTPQILAQAKSQFQTIEHPGVVVYDVEFDTTKAPFNVAAAREAVAYATNPAQVLNVVSPGFGGVVQDAEGPGGLLFEAKVPGARTYNLAKAKALVQKMGGLSFSFQYITSTALYPLGAQALAAQWEAAGIKVTLDPLSILNYDQDLDARSWNALFSIEGGVDPSVGVSSSLAEKFGLQGVQTCCDDYSLAHRITLLSETNNAKLQQSRAKEIYQYISNHQYSVPLFSLPTVVVAVKGLHNIDPAPNGTAGKELVPWQELQW